MSKIGVIDIDEIYLTSSKESVISDLLLFDKIVYIQNNSSVSRLFPPPAELTGLYHQKIEELDLLNSSKLIGNVSDTISIAGITASEDYPNLLEHSFLVQNFNLSELEKDLLSEATELDNRYYRESMLDGNLDLLSVTGYLDFWAKARQVRNNGLRVIASVLNTVDPASDYVPIIKGKLNPNSGKISNQRSEVMRVVSTKMPLLTGPYSIEALKEFKSDPDSTSKYLVLRNFINDLSKTELTVSEIDEKLSYLINEYESHLNIHRLKHTMGVIETIVTISATLLENLAKLKFGEVAKTIFSFNKTEIELLEAELKMPGREIAYIRKANEELG